MHDWQMVIIKQLFQIMIMVSIYVWNHIVFIYFISYSVNSCKYMQLVIQQLNNYEILRLRYIRVFILPNTNQLLLFLIKYNQCSCRLNSNMVLRFLCNAQLSLAPIFFQNPSIHIVPFNHLHTQLCISKIENVLAYIF